MQEHTVSDTPCVSAEKRDEISEDRVLTDDDLPILLDILQPIANKWKLIGTCLKLEEYRLLNVDLKSTYEDKLLELMRQWLKGLSPTPTARALVDVLRNRIIREEKIAIEVLRHFQPQTCQGCQQADDAALPTAVCMLGESETQSNSDRPCLEQQSSSNDSEDSDGQIRAHGLSNFSFPHLNTKDMSNNEIRSLCGRLTNEYRRINSSYSRLNRSIRKSLRDRHITPQQLAEVVMELNAFSVYKHDKCKPLLAQRLEEIENAGIVDNVFKILRPYGSFFDCYVIKHIVHSYLCTKEDKEKLKKYQEKLNDYCRRSIFECPLYATQSEQAPEFNVLTLKMDEDIPKSFTMKALDAFRDNLARRLQLESHTLCLHSVEEGCLKLKFQTPNFVKHKLFPLSCEQKKELESLHILLLKCDDDLIWIRPSQLQTPKRFCYMYDFKDRGCFQYKRHTDTGLMKQQISSMLLSPEKKPFQFEDIAEDIQHKLQESLSWMKEGCLIPKIVGRFGELVFDDPIHNSLVERNMQELVIDTATCTTFSTRIMQESSEVLSESCRDRGGHIDEIVTYSFIMETQSEKLNLTVKFKDEKPEIIAVFKSEYALAMYDICCLNSHYDIRLCLNYCEAASDKNSGLAKFLSTLHMPKPDTISFAAIAHDNEWTVALAQQKEIKTLFYEPPQYVITISTVRTYSEIDCKEDSNNGTIVSMCVDPNTSYTEIELHNLLWDVSFGHLLNLKPVESLSLLSSPEKIPGDWLRKICDAPKEWSPELVMKEFVERDFMKMFLHMNKIMDPA